MTDAPDGNGMLMLSASEIRTLVPIADAIAAMADAFTSVVDGTGDQPTRMVSKDGSALAMMARRAGPDGDGGTAFKLVSVRQANRTKGLPTVQALAVWFDAATGRPRLLIEGASLTSLRTGAASGLATDLLAASDAATLAMIGAGGQAADQIRAVGAVRAIREIRVFSPSGESASRLVENLRPELHEATISRVDSAVAAIADADVVCCATNSTSPVIPAEGLKDRVHVNAIGSYLPTMCELPDRLFARAQLVVVDELESALAESGEIIAALKSGSVSSSDLVELGDLIAAPQAVDGVTIFKSVGIALQDWAICRLLSERVPDHASQVAL
jgi:ornithine cyclodeaminase